MVIEAETGKTTATTETRDRQLVVFRLGKEEFGADISQIREIIRSGEITTIPQAPSYVDGIINLRGQITTVVNLRRRMGMEDRAPDSNSRIIVVQIEQSTVGLLVDSVAEVRYIKGDQIEPISSILVTDVEQKYILGVCRLKDHLLILVDLKNILVNIVA